jgi:hypothetical protein
MLMSHLGRHRRVVLAAGPVVGAAVGVITNIVTSQWNWWLFLGLLTAVSIAAGLAAVGDSGDSGEHAALRVLATGSRALRERVAEYNERLNAILEGTASPFALSALDDVAKAVDHANAVSQRVQQTVTYAAAAAGGAAAEAASDRWSRVLLTHPRQQPGELIDGAANVEGVIRDLADVQRDVPECQRFVGALRICFDDALAARQTRAAAADMTRAKAELERVESRLTSAAKNLTRYARSIT